MFGLRAALAGFLVLIPALSLAGLSTSEHNQWRGVIVYSVINAMGSGVPVSQCHVLTNEHVVRGGRKASVLVEGENYRADVVSLNNDNDLALLKIDTCPIQHYAKLAKAAPKAGDILTSIYYKPGFNFFNQMTKSHGRYRGPRRIVTEEDKVMTSMVIDDPRPRRRSSGGGVSSSEGLVSVIFGIASGNAKPTTYAVDYFALKSFLGQNGL